MKTLLTVTLLMIGGEAVILPAKEFRSALACERQAMRLQDRVSRQPNVCSVDISCRRGSEVVIRAQTVNFSRACLFSTAAAVP